jgi:O-antigen/teichoic acid export membrane protein
VVANYAGAATQILVQLLVIPILVRALGEAQWGVIGVMMTIQGVVLTLDAGMGQALVREFVVRGSPGGSAARSLLHSAERVYWFFGLLIALLFLACAQPVSKAWFDMPSGRIAVVGAGLICAMQLPGMLYRNAIVAAQGHVAMSFLLGVGALVRFGGGAIIVLLYPAIEAYICWYVVSLIAETLARGFLAWRLTGARPDGRQWRFQEFQSVLSSMSVLAGAAIVGSLTLQVDKLILSATQPMETFGYYFIASQLALGALQLIYPLVTSVLPRVIQARNSSAALRAMNLRLCGVVFLICGLCAVVYLTCGGWFLEFWLRDSRITMAVKPVLTILLVGIACNALANVGYINWLAAGRVWKIMRVNLLVLVTVAIGAWVLVPSMGVLGAATASAVGSVLMMIRSLEWVRNDSQQ